MIIHLYIENRIQMNLNLLVILLFIWTYTELSFCIITHLRSWFTCSTRWRRRLSLAFNNHDHMTSLNNAGWLYDFRAIIAVWWMGITESTQVDRKIVAMGTKTSKVLAGLRFLLCSQFCARNNKQLSSDHFFNHKAKIT